MPALIGRIVLQPTTVRPGATVRVEVLDPDDNPLAGTSAAVSINAVPGAVQYLQFPTTGQRRLKVRVRTPEGETDKQVALLDVAGAPVQFPAPGGLPDIAMIGVTQSLPQPYAAVLTLGSEIDVRSPHLLRIGPDVSPLPGLVFKKDSLPARLASQGGLGALLTASTNALTRVETRRLTGARTRPRGKPGAPKRVAVSAIYDLSRVDVAGQLRAPAAPLQEYQWDFGDGTTAATRTPTVVHDYFAAIDHAAGVGQFVVTCHVKHAAITVQRTLTIQSAYAICKATGTAVPHVTADLFAHKQHNMLTASFTVHNVEHEPMLLDRMSITPHSLDPTALALPRPFVTLGQPITVPARSASMIGVNVPFVTDNPANGHLRFDVEGFTVLYAGSVGGYPVRCSAVFDVPVAEWSKRPQPLKLPQVPGKQKKPWPWEIVQDALARLGNPADGITTGIPTLDVTTGTLAVTLGPLQALGSKAQTRNAGVRVVSAVFAPIERAMADARMLTAPAAQFMSAEAERLALAAPAAGTMMIARPPSAPMPAPMPTGHGSVAVRADVRLTPSPRFTLGGLPPIFHTLEGPPLPGFIAEGQVCDPDNITEQEHDLAEDAQLVCQLTDEVKDVLMPARWMNGRKGDCILSPGGDGLIGGLMLHVQPAQWYSHCGIMTRNYDEITHSTGSQKRLMDHLVGFTADGSDGFEPSVLKWIWPGAIRQTVQHSIEGENFPDPEYDKTYSISAFGPHTIGVTHNDQMKMIPPLVLKPDPLQETPAIRTALHAVATDASNSAGRPGIKPQYHYRWYCYTDPTIGLGAPEGPAAGWAEGTRPSVCSSYIWMHAKARSTRLETTAALVTPTDLEATPDLAQGAAVRPTTPDGLYNYSVAERGDAAEWLFDEIYNQAYEKAGWFGEIMTDAADDIANQFLNAFANDDADGKDSEEWQNLTDADAISPDNMLWWDGPSLGGLYGYAEPAIYREPRVESYTVSKWKKVLTRGTVRGRVFGASGPVDGAFVQVYDGKTVFSTGGGHYTLDKLPLGTYMLKASKVIDGVLYSAQVHTNLAVEDLVVDIHLQPPSEKYRVAQVFIDFFGRDYETFGDDELKDPGPEYFELELGPDKTVNTAGRTYKWGGEMRVEYAITVRLLVNNAIDVQVQGTLFEGTSEDTDDLDGTGGLTFQVAMGGTGGSTLTITNTDEDDDDAGVLSISVKNVRNDN